MSDSASRGWNCMWLMRLKAVQGGDRKNWTLAC